MSNVYVINKSGHDFSKAEEYGTLVFLSEGEINPFQMTKIYRMFAAILRDSSPDDCLLISGLAVMNSIASAILSHMHGRVNWLQWHPKYEEYRKRTIMIDDLIGITKGCNHEQENNQYKDR